MDQKEETQLLARVEALTNLGQEQRENLYELKIRLDKAAKAFAGLQKDVADLKRGRPAGVIP